MLFGKFKEKKNNGGNTGNTTNDTQKSIDENIRMYESVRKSYCETEPAEINKTSEFYKSDNWLRSKKLNPEDVHVHYGYYISAFYLTSADDKYSLTFNELNGNICHVYTNVETGVIEYIDNYYSDGSVVSIEFDERGRVISQHMSDSNDKTHEFGITYNGDDVIDGLVEHIDDTTFVRYYETNNNTTNSEEKNNSETVVDVTPKPVETKSTETVNESTSEPVKVERKNTEVDVTIDEKTEKEIEKQVKAMKNSFTNRLAFKKTFNELKKMIEDEGIKFDDKSDDPQMNQLLNILNKLDRMANGEPKKFTDAKKTTAAKLCVQLAILVDKITGSENESQSK